LNTRSRPDQETAIEDVKKDMETPTPMDRLLCGDVGYGKTEVAMRAAFKAVMDGKQTGDPHADDCARLPAL
jgi:Transcription-repair coupling factor (superfamily II helicase)